MQYQINGNQILVGLPTDQYYGVTPSNTNVPNILSTDKLPDAIDKLIGIIDKLAPAKSPGLITKSLSLVGTFYTARHVGSTTSTQGNVVWNTNLGTTQSATTASSYAFVLFDSTNPIARVADSSTVNSGYATFSDGQNGYVQVDIDYQTVVQKYLDSGYYTLASASVSPDVGTWGNSLGITFDGDPYNVAPNQGFWTSLKAQVTGTQAFASGATYDGQEHIYYISHSTTGTSQPLKFICDNGDLTPPTSLNGDPYFTVITQSSTKWVSGIPSLAVGDWISASYSFNNTAVSNRYPLISRFYNSTRITRFNMSATSSPVSKDDLNASGIPVMGGTNSVPYAYQPTWDINGLTVSVTSNMFTDLSTTFPNGAIFYFNTYNPKNNSSVSSNYTIGGYGAPAGKKVFIDTVSNESSRLRSGQGLYPSQGTAVSNFGESYGNYSTMSVYGSISVVGSEMMLYGGLYQYPSLNFTSNWPVSGSNYTSPLDDTNATLVSGNYYRWVTFNIGSISGQQNCTITLNGANTILTSATLNNSTGNYISNFLMYVKVVGGSGTGWLNANLDAITLPSVDGDGCLVKNQSTSVSRKISFGTTPRTGSVYVRIGFTTTPAYKFSSLTLS